MAEPQPLIELDTFAEPTPFEMQAAAWLADDDGRVNVVQRYLFERARLGDFERGLEPIMARHLADDPFLDRCRQQLAEVRANSEFETKIALLLWWPGCNAIDNPN
jgi:hypothetical protein